MKYQLPLLFLFLHSLCFAQNPRKEVVTFEDAYKRTYQATHLDQERPKIDGKLDDELWQTKGQWSEKFSQVIPFERVHTASWTRMKIFYDHENIYIGVYCKDEHPETMNAFIGNRDDNSNGDLISIAFDTYHDYRVASEFNINLGGNKTDLTVTDKLSVNLSWNAVWEGKTHINMADSSWTAELRIPFSQLRYTQKNQDGIWGLHVRRIIRKNNEVQNWSLIPIKNNGHVFSFGEMHGMTDLPKPRGIEILPHVLTKYTRDPKIENSPFQKGSKGTISGGLDLKAAINDFTMDVTINPDYGQVELDPSVMNLSAYETFYDEKRPFFLEGRHILEFDNNEGGMMFYSRRIGAMPTYRPKNIDNNTNFSSTPSYIPILGALKLTGTNKNGVTVGLLESITAQTSSKVSRDGIGSKEVTEPLTNYTVARVQKNWEGNTLLGAMVTSVNRKLGNQEHLKELMIENAFTTGIDFTQYFANRLYYIDAKGMFSTINGSPEAILNTKMNATHYYHRESGSGYLNLDPDKNSLLGTGGYVKVGKKGNAQWNYSQTFSWSSPGFDLNDVGYLRESDYKANESEIAFRKTDPWGPFRFAGINLTQKNVWNYGGRPTNNNVAIRFRSLTTKHRFETDIKETFSWNTVDSRRLRGGPDIRYNPNMKTELLFSTDRAKKTMFKLNYIGQHFFNQETSYNTINPSLTLRLGNHVLMTGQLNYAQNTDDLQYVNTITSSDWSNQTAYLMGRMKQETYGFTLNFQTNITPDLSIQYYGSPFTSVAKYDKFKLAADTRASRYDDRFTAFQSHEITEQGDQYHVEQGSNKMTFKNPNFSFNEFRSNLVARWEYLPGSTMHFVWEHNRSGQDARYYSGWGNNLDHMFGLPATNTFMLKINYWFNL